MKKELVPLTEPSINHRRFQFPGRGNKFAASMTQALHDVFSGLEMTQYLGAFLDQGFDTWDSVLDITEPDLYVETPLSDNRLRFSKSRMLTTDMHCREALGVKLGHRRVSWRSPHSSSSALFPVRGSERPSPQLLTELPV